MQTQLSHYQERVNQTLKHHLQHFSNQQNGYSNNLFPAIEYATLNQGKRLRPALIYAVADALAVPLDQVDSAACAIELIHSYSLVHDDLPAMDNDDLRRGQPTCHIQFDEATAILAGDAQQTLAFQILSEDNALKPPQIIEMIRLLSRASGPLGMIGGQVLDIQSEGKTISLSALKTLHSLKTGALIQCALLMGAVTSENYRQIQPGLANLGELIGLAFQVQDDILDIEGDTKTLGKPQGSDMELDKSTYPKLLGLAEAKIYRDDLITQAKAELRLLDINSPFLFSLIDYIADRKH
ncbi:geranyltranstransferase [Thiomicrorhabdus immobilis]|uniref:Geranyltranstransferase n=1 Tax=Thiomicrorhabdus immobilis TaxID=2791037 RepID=A0ABN6CWT1_9GAMM|nr:farnesyl diphosphate synthase [Thiomicrorhabdus immobilis]BCN93149.1 geranyltranstransferase [Thiomicrorhabdus immobilis]